MKKPYIPRIGKVIYIYLVELWKINAFKRKQVKKKVKVRNGYNQVPHPTRDTIWESDKNIRKYKKQEREPRGQSFPSK